MLNSGSLATVGLGYIIAQIKKKNKNAKKQESVIHTEENLDNRKYP